jgi:TusA-related sulfurtransferase
VNVRTLFVCAFALTASLGCNDAKPTSGTLPTATATAQVKTAIASVQAPPTAAPSTTATGSDRGKMVHCPSAVDGVATDIKDVDGGVVVTVTTKDEAKTKEIRERAKFLSDASKTEGPSKQHNGTGAGGGAFGRCPVVNRNTTVETENIEGGSKITVKPKEPAEVDWVRRESRERLKELGEPGAREAGQGKMAHCPSAIDETTTTVKATKDAVVVTIVAKDEAKTKEIRERATFLAEASKKDPASAEHKGDGSGGGGFGRCPIIVKDTTVTVKEVAGGAEATVKPKAAADVPALEKEAKERAEKLAKR